MASVVTFAKEFDDFYAEFQKRCDIIEDGVRERYKACQVVQKFVRGYLTRKYLRMLNQKATVIQKHFRAFMGRKLYRKVLSEIVNKRFTGYYNAKVNVIKRWYRGYWTRQHLFSYRAFKNWMNKVSQANEEVINQNNLYREVTRQHRLDETEQGARDWVIFVLFKLHHLIRTHQIEGIYSYHYKHELSTFEKMLKQIKYKEYMNKLRRRYCDYVKARKPRFERDYLYPGLGNAEAYWYMRNEDISLLATPADVAPSTREKAEYYDKHLHPKPFRVPLVGDDAAFVQSIFSGPREAQPTDAALRKLDHDLDISDKPFDLYRRKVRVNEATLNYIEYHINVLLEKTCSVHEI